MPNADVFISYRRDQREQVLVIAEKLQELGLSVWFDARLEAGTSFDEEINREVRSAKAVFVCWSPDAIQSRWVRAEASIGLERDVLVAAFLHPTELIPPYNLVHAANLEGWDGSHDATQWRDVLTRIGKLVRRPQLADEARAKGLESQWVDRDRNDRATFEHNIEEARRRFSALHQSRPAAFEQGLTDLRASFEAWLLRRRMGSAGPAPDPLKLVEDQAAALRTELEIAQRERDAALATAERERQARGAEVAAAAAAAAAQTRSPSARAYGGARTFGGAFLRAITVLFLGPIAMALWGMRRYAALWVTIFAVASPMMFLQSCGLAATTEEPAALENACYDNVSRRWRVSTDGEFTDAPQNQYNQTTGQYETNTRPQIQDTCWYKDGYRQGQREGDSRVYYERERATSRFFQAVLGIAILENFAFFFLVMITGFVEASGYKGRTLAASGA